MYQTLVGECRSLVLLWPQAMSKRTANLRPSIPVIDLFAGPGGLGEGFSAFEIHDRRPFEVRLSIEKDAAACRTLRLRAMVRQFEEPPRELLEYYSGRTPLREAMKAFPDEAAEAESGVWHAELGRAAPATVARAVRNRLRGSRDWVLLGGPPCQAYSIAGRSRMRTTRPDFELDERHFLYREYLRIMADHQPAVFVLENVKGLITSKHGGRHIVTRILDDLSDPAKAIGAKRHDARGYRLYALGQRQASLPWMDAEPQDGEDFLVKAEEFGIPQMRHRIFIVGVRTDVPGRPSTLQNRTLISAGDVLSDLPPIRSQLSREEDSLSSWRAALTEILECEWMAGSTRTEMVPVRREIRRVIAELPGRQFTTGGAYLDHRRSPRALGNWYRRFGVGLTHHESRAHMRSDLHRYLFAAAYSRVHAQSPELSDFPERLRPAHRNVMRAIEEGELFNDRFRVQLEGRPSTTITSHIRKDGHYYIHYDPMQCRSLTPREAARLQTFPDDYFFEGNRTDQYQQIGNAVPPLLAVEIAQVVYELFESVGLSSTSRVFVRA